jgi:peptidyl-prolyl cis-trans isomerase B (cyclophilin B)
MLEALSRDHWCVTAGVIHGLGELAPNDTAVAREHRERTPGIIRRVLEEDPESERQPDIRKMAAEALGNFDSEEARETLRGLLDDEDYYVRLQAAESLEKLGETRPEVKGPYDLPGPAEPLDESYLKTRAGKYVATIKTNRGEIKIELFHRDAPRTVQSFAHLAREGFYDDVRFHRVVPNFVIQGGCPIGNGWGHPGYTLRCEVNRHRYERGTVGMAHAGKDTGGSQFFITHSPQPHLNGRYTVFGRVVDGMDVVDAILAEDVIESVEVTKKLF